MPLTTGLHDQHGTVAPDEWDEATVATAQLLLADIPEEFQVPAPQYYIDFYTDPENPVYFESGIYYPIRFNSATGTYFTLVEGVRLIVFERTDADVLAKVHDYDLRIHRFNYADILTREMLLELVWKYRYLSAEIMVNLLGINELLEHGDDHVRNLEAILAVLFGKPLYEWGWFVSGYDYGVEIVDDGGTMMVKLVDEETVTSKIPHKRRHKQPTLPDGLKQLTFAGWGSSVES